MASALSIQESNAMRQERLETLGTALWLLMDFSWLVEWASIGMVLGMFGFGSFVLVLRYIERSAASWAANGSAACWLLMNFSWMVGESYTIQLALRAAAAFGVLAITLLLVSVWTGGLSGPVMHQFRRIKVWRHAGQDKKED